MFSSGLYMYETMQNAYPSVNDAVPRTSLGYTTNNKYPGFPSLMNDGRSIVPGWQHDAAANAELIRKNGITSNWQYRQYLQHNALDVMKSNLTEASNDAGYYKRPVDVMSIQSNRVEPASSTPALYASVLDTTQVMGSTASDLKKAYLTREQLDSRKVSPVITQDMFLRNLTQPAAK
jgi:hypothetical protein